MNDGQNLWSPVLRAAFFAEVRDRLERGLRGSCLTGLVEGSRSLLLTLLAIGSRRGLLLVVSDDAAVEAFHRDLAALSSLLGRDPKRIVAFPALDCDPYDSIAPHPEILRDRVVALDAMRRGRFEILVTPARALLMPLPAPEDWGAWITVVREGVTLPPDRFVLQCMGLGYRRVDIVSAPGEVSRRGGILDVFPPSSEEPVRIELFGDTVESLRAFDTDRQRSTGKLTEVAIGPATECPPDDHALRRVSRYLQGGMQQAGTEGRPMRPFRELLDALQNQGYWPGLEALTRLIARRPVLLFEHAAEAALVVDEPHQTAHELRRASDELAGLYEQSSNRILPPPSELFGDAARIEERLRRADLFLQELAGEEPREATAVFHVACRSARSYAGRIPELIQDLRTARERGARTICLTRAPGSAERLREILGEYELEPTPWPDVGAAADVADGGLFVGQGALRSGFDLPELGLAVLTERDVFGEKRKVSDRKSGGRAAFISDFRDLKPGDLVVHTDHGIARFAGLGRPKGGSLNRDFMVLEFSRGDRLFVPVDRLDLVQRYSGVGGKPPVLDRLGGPSWERVKSRVRKSVESMAKDLLDLYARRKTATGHRFGPDTPWQAELEAAFPFELTSDQQRAVKEIKEDMESERSADRLLVGDVGFGKTEVAVRATFKAVMDGFQVAILAPTTVLAFQHLQTFRERFAPYPTRVEMVSRFRSPAEIRQVLQDLELGAVDVLIGTHRLLSRDVRFRRLGLLVVDEEQRFGVAHKERLKSLSIGIDVLSMTATPIPRTLQMSLAGVRDLSVIETPPPGRMAIQTYMIPFRRNILAQAIRQELRRKGQIFVVHNKIATLPAITRAISDMVPEARIVMAHGQLPERRLEQVMLRFVSYEADVLVTTTIIENGLDIPRANTIIVNRADHLGLAQLYQLRGRVGRSHEHAYAYFVVPARDNLSDEARKRLRALQEFNELGAGFRLAAADLEIRGAGELLGARQHGHIASLGFDLYCQMLDEAVRKLSGEPVAERQPTGLHLGIDIKIPQNFLPDAGDRLVIYKRLAQARLVEEVDLLQAETEDRYGHLPSPAKNLFDMGRLRLVAEQIGVRSIDLVEGRLQIRFHDKPPIEPAVILDMVARRQGSLTPSGTVILPAPLKSGERIEIVGEILRQMADRDAA